MSADSALIDGSTLTNLDDWRSVLQLAQHRLDCKKQTVAASQLTKWYCRAHCSVLYSLSVEDISMSASLQDISLSFPDEPPIAVNIRGKMTSLEDYPSRDDMRINTLRSLFAGNINIVFSAMIQLTGVRADILWDNAAVYIHHFYRTWMEETADEDRRAFIKEDYDYIIKTADAELFGSGHRVNPLYGSCAPFRNTCCLRVQMPGANKCKGCPLDNRDDLKS